MADRWRAAWARLSDWIVFAAVVVMIVLTAYSFWAIHQTHQIVVSHDQELAQTKAIANEILGQTKQQQTNHAGTLTYLEAICASTPGCPEAVQKMVAAG
jgi:type VI protein secretion system component VasF